MAKTEFSYEVVKKLGKLGDDSNKELRIVKWGDNDAKLDLRGWWEGNDGNEKCGKGISLTASEAKELVKLLNDYLEEEDEDEDF